MTSNRDVVRDAARATSDETLSVVLHAHAITRDRSTLLLQLLDGTVMATVALFSHARPWLFVASAGVGLVMHAVWSVADRRLTTGDAMSHPGRRRSWRAARAAGAILGVGAVFAMLLLSCGMVLGTWIS